MISIQRLVNRVLFGLPMSSYAVARYHAVAWNPHIQLLGIIDSIGNETWV